MLSWHLMTDCASFRQLKAAPESPLRFRRRKLPIQPIPRRRTVRLAGELRIPRLCRRATPNRSVLPDSLCRVRHSGRTSPSRILRWISVPRNCDIQRGDARSIHVRISRHDALPERCPVFRAVSYNVTGSGNQPGEGPCEGGLRASCSFLGCPPSCGSEYLHPPRRPTVAPFLPVCDLIAKNNRIAENRR